MIPSKHPTACAGKGKTVEGMEGEFNFVRLAAKGLGYFAFASLTKLKSAQKIVLP